MLSRDQPGARREGHDGAGMERPILDGVVREGFSEVVTCELRSDS